MQKNYKEIAEKEEKKREQKEGFPKVIFLGVIRFYQQFISPANGPKSHFFPSSSQYTLECIQKYGTLQGAIMGFDRLIRENDDPWLYCTVLMPHGSMKIDLS